MPDYRLSLDFTAADDTQAARLAEAWADTCAAEYGTRYAGYYRTDQPWCEWCGRAIDRTPAGRWLAVKGAERGYDPIICDVSDDHFHAPSENQPARGTGCYDAWQVFDKRTQWC